LQVIRSIWPPPYWGNTGFKTLTTMFSAFAHFEYVIQHAMMQ